MKPSHPNPDSIQLLEEMVKEARTNGLVLFVGAGINSNSLPLWTELLTTLFSEAISVAGAEDSRVVEHAAELMNWCSSHFDVCSQASILKQLLGSNRYRLELQDALYAGRAGVEESVREYCGGSKQQGPDGEYQLLRAIAELASLPAVKGVATFNFDTLLEAAILGIGKKHPLAYFGETAAPDAPDSEGKPVIPIFHLHGLLSPPDTLLRSSNESVVFSYDEYFEKNADPMSWETSTPIHLLRNFTTLWIGASLKDWNMLRLLYAARSSKSSVKSYCIQSLMEAGNEKEECFQEFKAAAMRFHSTLYESVGLRLIVAGQSFQSVFDTISTYITKPLRNKPRVVSSKPRKP